MTASRRYREPYSHSLGMVVRRNRWLARTLASSFYGTGFFCAVNSAAVRVCEGGAEHVSKSRHKPEFCRQGERSLSVLEGQRYLPEEHGFPEGGGDLYVLWRPADGQRQASYRPRADPRDQGHDPQIPHHEGLHGSP